MPTPKGRAGTPAAEPGPVDRSGRRRAGGWVLGGVVFAAVTMSMVGFFQVVQGLAAVFQKDVELVDPGVLFPFDLTVWGVVHLVIGVVLIAAGFAVRAAQPWARAVGVAFAALSAVTNFLFVPYSPAWSSTIIVMDVLVIWALCVYRWDVTRDERSS